MAHSHRDEGKMCYGGFPLPFSVVRHLWEFSLCDLGERENNPARSFDRTEKSEPMPVPC